MDSPVALQSLADLYTQPFVVIDRRLRVRLVNRAFEEAYGIGRGDAVGRPCHGLLHSGPTRPCPCGPDGSHCPFREVFEGVLEQVSVNTHQGRVGGECLVRIQGHALRTASGEVLLGELIQTVETTGSQSGASDPRAGADGGARLVGDSGLFRQVLGKLRVVAAAVAPVLLEGPTGTGKELAAGYIHRHSARAAGPFITLDCTTLGEDLFESEVFGHERGAFTGSVGERQGLFERAHGGTLFLDEIGELPLSMQAKLLRVLESGEYRRVGADRTRRADVRVVCATNRDLRDSTGFRPDLYFRIACLRVRMPALAERTEDIQALARELLLRIGTSAGRDFILEREALALLQTHPFPGNVRELRNLLWVAAVHSPDGHIGLAQVALAMQAEPYLGLPLAAPQTQALSSDAPSGLTLRDLEARHLRDLLVSHGGSRRAMAAALKVSERTLYRKLRRYGLSNAPSGD